MLRRDGNIPNDLARLKGARFVFASEVEKGRRLAVSLVKDLTGGDTITARFMRAEWFDFRPEFKLWLATNHKPVIKDTKQAIWRRIRLVPFAVSIPKAEQDKKLPEKLLAELPGILAWAVWGCLDWQRAGLDAPAEVEQATADYRAESDELAAWLAECCFIGPKARAGSDAARKSYMDFTGYKITSNEFADLLIRHGYKKDRSGGHSFWFGFGLLNPPAPNQPL
jgi:putative DNA primase/helicase